MAFIKFLTMMAFATVLLPDLAVKVKANGICKCLSLGVCPGFEVADVVLRGTVLARTEPVEGDTTYILDTKALFKVEPKVKYGKEISVVSSSASCGATLELGEQYLLGLKRSDGDQLTVSVCGLVRLWSAVTKEERASLRAGCEDDPCDGSCGKFQECLFHSDNVADEYYCADVCDPSPCEDGEKCTLEQLVQCIRAPCPPSAVCSGSKN